MQFKFLFFIFATFLVMETKAYMWSASVPVNSAYPGKCFVERYSMLLEFGKEYPVPRECERMICDETLNSDYKHKLSIAGCGSIGVPPHCKLSEVDLRKVYPDCCPTLMC